MRRNVMLIIFSIVLLVLLGGCSSEKDVPASEETKSDRIQIVATLFPQYDFARQIAGDKAEVTLLLPPGVESHSYEPTPSDIIKINRSDLFLYTGKNMEVWSEKIITGIKDAESQTVVLDVSENIELTKTSDIEAELQANGMVLQETEEHEHEHFYDPHIWTDPLIAKVMVTNIRDSLCKIDPDNGDYYKENAAKYNSELDQLDAEFITIVNNGKRKEIIFGSRFALYYFVKQYGLTYQAAFDSCSSETEPSAKTVAKLIEKIKEGQIPVIYYAEIEEPRVAKSISGETGAKMLLFHSCHNITKEELEEGATYLSLMKQNAQNLKEGLN